MLVLSIVAMITWIVLADGADDDCLLHTYGYVSNDGSLNDGDSSLEIW